MQESTCHLECSTVCVVDGSGKIVREAIVGSEPEPLIGWFGSLGLGLTRVGLGSGTAVAMALCGDKAGWTCG